MVPQLRTLVLSGALAACVDPPATSAVSAPGMLNGMLNGFFLLEGLDAFVSRQCPELYQALRGSGDLTRPFSDAFAEEIARDDCDHLMIYTVELMEPYGQSLTLF